MKTSIRLAIESCDKIYLALINKDNEIIKNALSFTLAVKCFAIICKIVAILAANCLKDY